MQLSRRLAKLRDETREHAIEFGLDFYDVIFEMVGFDEMNQIAAYGGFPTRYPHWRWGMEYEQLSKGYTYGLQKIYELVINNDPSVAYLLESNAEVDQKLVMAHVYGHVDFFKHNYCFSPTNRKMIDQMANHATRVRRYIDKYGLDKVEDCIDRALSLDNLIDYNAAFIKRKPEKKPEVDLDQEIRDVPKFKIDREYMRDYINPKEFLDEQRKKLEQERARERKHPEEPERDVVGFIMKEAPLESWERDVLDIVRDESTYFAPQGQTKIMNEGWASYWHSTIMTTRTLTDDEVVDYADHHSGTMGVQPGRINPYKLGLELFRDIEERWNKGRFGREYDECEDYSLKRSWDHKLGLGREKIFEVRRYCNDVTFIDTFLTPEFAMEQKMFTYGFNARSGNWEIFSREFKKIKDQLLSSLTNFGQPDIRVEDANHDNKGELLLRHVYEGVDLRGDYARDTLKNVASFWKRPVNLATEVKGKKVVLRFDGADFTTRE